MSCTSASPTTSVRVDEPQPNMHMQLKMHIDFKQIHFVNPFDLDAVYLARRVNILNSDWSIIPIACGETRTPPTPWWAPYRKNGDGHTKNGANRILAGAVTKAATLSAMAAFSLLRPALRIGLRRYTRMQFHLCISFPLARTGWAAPKPRKI